ncbi:MAG: tetratricopeptide repeat protein [Candidatus Eremiobacteraeota bacterium]|nr:tetratricopeptide repeat protein [Candidatus Eremiobacteraeota bacterium]
MNQVRITILLWVIILLLPNASCGRSTYDRPAIAPSGETSPGSDSLIIDDKFSTFNVDQYETEDIYDVTSILEPASGPAMQKKAIQLRREGKYEQSLQVLNDAIELYPGKAGLWFSKGKTFAYMGKFKKAEECMTRSTRIKPGPEIWYFAGVLKAYIGKYDESMKCFDNSIALKPSPNAWYSKGITYDDLEKNKEALECYDKSLAIDNSYRGVWYSKGIVLLQLNRYDEARKAFSQAKKLGHHRADRALKALSKKGL